MDPSYNQDGQGNAGIPGAKPGVIASGPDVPVVETPQLMDAVVLNNGGGQRQSRRGLLIGGLTLLGVALIGGIIALIMINGGGGGGSTTVNGSTALKDASRYLLFGNIESEDDMSKVELQNAKFMSVVMIQPYEEQQDYFTKAKEYVQTLKNVMNGGNLANAADTLARDVVLLEKVGEVSYTDVLLQKYLAGGETEMQNYMADIAGLEMSDNVPVDMISTSEEMMTASLDLYNSYERGGCIIDGVINGDCVTNITENSTAIMAATNKVSGLKIKVRNYLMTLGRAILTNIKGLNGINDMDNEVQEGVTENE